MWYILSAMNQKIEQIKNKIIPTLKKAGVTRSSIFGSVVRGEASEDSDVDILVELPEGKTLLDLVGLELDLKDILKKNVDLVTYRSISPYLKDIILREQVRIL
jgi:predicted nucleotidyltransferase